MRRCRLGGKTDWGLFLIIVGIIFIIACDQEPLTSAHEQIVSGNEKECIEPQNPYNDDGGHNAGYNWALENGNSCNGNSDAFNEGCEEYYRQLNQYHDCLAQKRH